MEPEKIMSEKMTLTKFKVVLEKFMLARSRYMDKHTSLSATEWKAADLELALAYNRYMAEGRK
tara:strand:- start:331 stop:519 length:189 start_codon:yes stop_codon:yes gene_type:complete